MTSKLTIALLASCLSGAAFAAGSDYSSDTMQPGSTPGSAEFNKLDTNNDGNLTESELSSKPALKEDWAKIDSNNDGKIDRSEFSMFEAQENPGGGKGSSSDSSYK